MCSILTKKSWDNRNRFLSIPKETYGFVWEESIKFSCGCKASWVINNAYPLCLREAIAKKCNILCYWQKKHDGDRFKKLLFSILDFYYLRGLVINQDESLSKIELFNGSEIYFTNDLRGKGRNGNETILIVDNAAFVNLKDFKLNLWATLVDPKIKVILASCLNPYSLFNYLTINRNDFSKKHIKWQDSPNYDYASYEKTKHYLDTKNFITEIDSKMSLEEKKSLTNENNKGTIFAKFEEINRIFSTYKQYRKIIRKNKTSKE